MTRRGFVQGASGAAASLLLANACATKPAAAPAPPVRTLRVLFLGNSYVGVNDLPSVFTRLAASARPPLAVETDRNTPEMTEKLDAAYRGIGAELHAVVAPAGLAFACVRRERPTLTLHAADGSHPTPAGTYLAACTIFAALAGRSPVGAADKVFKDLQPADALYLQETAAAVWGEFGKK